VPWGIWPSSRTIFQAPKRDYAGARTIVSNPPDSTKGVQTIRRPDLLSPPKLAYPLRLPSLMTLPAAVLPAPVRRNLEHPVAPNPRKPLIVRAIEPRIPNPALPIDLLKLSLLPARPPLHLLRRRLCNRRPSLPHKWRHERPRQPAPPKAKVSSESARPVHCLRYATSSEWTKSSRRNQCSLVVPPNSLLLFSDAELTTRFCCGTLAGSNCCENTSGAGAGKAAGVAASSAAGNSRTCLSRMGSETKVDAADANGELANGRPPPSAGAHRHLAQPGQRLRLQRQRCQESQSRAAFQDAAAVWRPLILNPRALMV